MSLHVYDSLDKIDVIEDNDVYFDNNTMLVDCAIVRSLLQSIDKASYYNKDYFLDRNGAKLPRECLSSGCKTALNIALNPGKCFSSIECGRNATLAILYIQEGNVLLWDRVLRAKDDLCNVEYKGKHFGSINCLLRNLRGGK